jgi:hypothetical protein
VKSPAQAITNLEQLLGERFVPHTRRVLEQTGALDIAALQPYLSNLLRAPVSEPLYVRQV